LDEAGDGALVQEFFLSGEKDEIKQTYSGLFEEHGQSIKDAMEKGILKLHCYTSNQVGPHISWLASNKNGYEFVRFKTALYEDGSVMICSSERFLGNLTSVYKKNAVKIDIERAKTKTRELSIDDLFLD
jgi:hypothetical protein